MKKILISILLVFAVVSLSGCGTKKENNVEPKVKIVTLEDENFGKTTLKYDEEKDYKINEEYSGKYVEVTISSEKENFELQLYHFDTSDISYSNNQETRKNSDNYKEYNWNNFSGYSYGGSKDSIKFNILLDKDENGNAKVLFGSMESIDYNTANIPETFENENIQKLLNSITFEK